MKMPSSDIDVHYVSVIIEFETSDTNFSSVKSAGNLFRLVPPNSAISVDDAPIANTKNTKQKKNLVQESKGPGSMFQR